MGSKRRSRQRKKKQTLPEKRDAAVERQIVRPNRGSTAVQILQLDTLTEETAKGLIETAAKRMAESHDSKEFQAYANFLIALADQKTKADKVQNERLKQEVHLHQHQHGRFELDDGRTNAVAVAESLGLSISVTDDGREVVDGTVQSQSARSEKTG